VTLEEVDQAIKDKPIGKSPRMNGFTMDFFQYFWHMVQEEVWKIIENSHNTLSFLLSLNATFLILIPQK
jgi:hypothetical protein